MFGTIVPDFQFKDINGNRDNLYNIQAPFKLIDFWASWCAPCLAELPELKAFHTKNKNVAIISFSIDYDKVAWVESSKKNGISWYSFSDSKGPEGKFASYFSVQQIPLMILLDGNNKIIKYDVKMSEVKNYIERE
jgi:thiol-disulfide isomerase/thioredoxin